VSTVSHAVQKDAPYWQGLEGTMMRWMVHDGTMDFGMAMVYDMYDIYIYMVFYPILDLQLWILEGLILLLPFLLRHWGWFMALDGVGPATSYQSPNNDNISIIRYTSDTSII
jgi:hypothetical protein